MNEGCTLCGGRGKDEPVGQSLEPGPASLSQKSMQERKRTKRNLTSITVQLPYIGLFHLQDRVLWAAARTHIYPTPVRLHEQSNGMGRFCTFEAGLIDSSTTHTPKKTSPKRYLTGLNYFDPDRSYRPMSLHKYIERDKI